MDEALIRRRAETAKAFKAMATNPQTATSVVLAFQELHNRISDLEERVFGPAEEAPREVADKVDTQGR